MSKSEGPIILGRFIKKGTPLAKIVSVSKFNLTDVCKTHLTYPDNPHANIIHSALHPKEELRTIKLSKDIENNLDQAGFRPALQPIDFTNEWERQKKRLGGSSSRYDEEDELELELEYLSRKGGPTKGPGARAQASQKSEAVGPDKGQQEASQPVAQTESSQPASQPENESEITSEAKPEVTSEAKPEVTSEAKPEVTSEAKPEVTSEAKSEATSEGTPEITSENHAPKKEDPAPLSIDKESIDSVGEAINKIAESESKTKELSSTTVPIQNEQDDQFVPMEPPEVSDSNAEIKTMKPYKHHLSNKIATQINEQQIIEEAKAYGFNEGFKVGEEKAAVQFQQNSSEIVKKFTDTLNELENLKKTVLENAQENFQIICQAMLESLLKKEFSINPDSLTNIIQRAIAEAVPTDQFKIIAHPDTIHMIEDFLDDKTRNKLHADDHIEPYDFRIESNLTVVDGKIRTILKDLLEQVDLNLFEIEENAS